MRLKPSTSAITLLAHTLCLKYTIIEPLLNLYDLIKRNDQWLSIRGSAQLAHHRIDGQLHRTVVLAEGTILTLKNAHQVQSLNDNLVDVVWQIFSARRETALEVIAVTRDADSEKQGHKRSLLSHQTKLQVADLGSPGVSSEPIAFTAAVADYQEFDLEIRCLAGDCVIVVGPLLSMVARVTDGLSGKGVEVGPGLNPQIRPSRRTDIAYIEQTAPEDWEKLYNSKIPDELTQQILARYQIDNASAPDKLVDHSLDFVFSNHVCEHFANFGQVLINWSNKLKPGGRFCGVVPDCRYSFDYRQKPTELAEIIQWQKAGGFEISDDMYKKWCSFTEPRHDIESLKARGYSIHVSYFTPSSLSNIFQHYCSQGSFQSFSIWCAPNNRDIAFSLLT